MNLAGFVFSLTFLGLYQDHSTRYPSLTAISNFLLLLLALLLWRENQLKNQKILLGMINDLLILRRFFFQTPTVFVWKFCLEKSEQSFCLVENGRVRTQKNETELLL